MHKLLLSAVLFGSVSVSALDLGPFYIKIGNVSCDRAAVFVREDGSLYGREVGCLFVSNPYIGVYDRISNTFYFSIEITSAATSFKKTAVTYQINALTNTATAYSTDGVTGRTVTGIPVSVSTVP